MLYSLTVAVCAGLIIALNLLLGGELTLYAAGKISLITLCGVAAAFVTDAVCAFAVRRLPERWFLPEARLFSVGKRELEIYRRIRLSRLKRWVPEWGCFTGFHKDKLRSSADTEYLARFLLESNYGVLGHVAGAVCGFALMLIPIFDPFTMALPIAAVNAFLSLLPTAILRSNTPALRRLYRRSLARDERSEKTK